MIPAIDWTSWKPLGDGSVALDTKRRGKRLFELIVEEHPHHADHWVRFIRVVGAKLAVTCSCSSTYHLD